ncbi:MAG: TetR family transcriptional regulator [Kiritimatiellales bacterium]
MRRTKEDAEKTRISILKAALKVFYAKGVSRATLSDISKAAGLSRGAIHWHFRDKSDLFLQLYDYMSEKTPLRARPWSDESIQTLDELKQVLLAGLESYFTDREVRRFLIVIFSRMEYIAEFDELCNHELAYQQKSVRELEQVYERLRSAGEIHEWISPYFAARHTYIFIDGMIDCLSINDETFLTKDQLAAAVNEFFRLFDMPSG